MAVNLPIFMDYHSTTRSTRASSRPWSPTSRPSSATPPAAITRSAGLPKACDTAREQVAALIGASGKEMIWTSGATESNNLAIKGAAHFYKDRGNHIITTQVEHKSVLDSCKRLENEGFEVTYLAVEADGSVSPDRLREAMTDRTILVSIMLANNEIGTVNDLPTLGAIVKERGALFHTDAVQGVGKVPFDVDSSHVDLLAMTGHKIYAPRASARCTSVASPASASSSRWTAAVTSAACAPARSTSPASSASAGPARSCAPKARKRASASAPSATDSNRASCRACPRSTSTAR